MVFVMVFAHRTFVSRSILKCKIFRNFREKKSKRESMTQKKNHNQNCETNRFQLWNYLQATGIWVDEKKNDQYRKRKSPKWSFQWNETNKSLMKGRTNRSQTQVDNTDVESRRTNWNISNVHFRFKKKKNKKIKTLLNDWTNESKQTQIQSNWFPFFILSFLFLSSFPLVIDQNIWFEIKQSIKMIENKIRKQTRRWNLYLLRYGIELIRSN